MGVKVILSSPNRIKRKIAEGVIAGGLRKSAQAADININTLN